MKRSLHFVFPSSESDGGPRKQHCVQKFDSLIDRIEHDAKKMDTAVENLQEAVADLELNDDAIHEDMEKLSRRTRTVERKVEAIYLEMQRFKEMHGICPIRMLNCVGEFLQLRSRRLSASAEIWNSDAGNFNDPVENMLLSDGDVVPDDYNGDLSPVFE
jgi:hypothetical protein